MTASLFHKTEGIIMKHKYKLLLVVSFLYPGTVFALLRPFFKITLSEDTSIPANTKDMSSKLIML